MTEAEWLASDDPTAMLNAAFPKTDRKLRLFSAACCRRVCTVGGPRRDLEDAEYYLHAIEQNADDPTAIDDWDDAVERILRKQRVIQERDLDLLESDFCAFLCAVDNDPPRAALWAAVNANIALSDGFTKRPEPNEVAGSSESLVQAAFLRDIFGNPFRPVALDPGWLTSDVCALARGIYDDRAFDRMPILADALQDAGCDNSDVLTHCRDANQVHTRGCWVIDLLLGKG